MCTKSNVAIKFSNGDMQENQMLLPIDIDRNTFLCIGEKKKKLKTKKKTRKQRKQQ